MRRRTFLGAMLLSFPTSNVAFAGTKGVRISNLWFDSPRSDSGGLNPLKGVLNFQVDNERTTRQVSAYWRGTQKASPKRECPELIKRYAAALGFLGYSMANRGFNDDGNSLASLGASGSGVAREFANKSKGGFVYVSNSAVELPKAGAVISIRGWSTVPDGHVGILGNHDAPGSKTKTVSIKLFDQNMPIKSWKTIDFARQKDGTWKGTMTNNGVQIDVVGWANPAG